MSLRSEPRAHPCHRAWCLALLLSVAAAGCEREERNFRQSEAADEGTPLASGYDESAYAVGEGKRLYVWFNCVGCHAMGGGGMGPPLMDDAWRYGSHPADIFETITHGRPNGMPAFGDRITEQQRWRLVAYVRSMSGLVPKDRRPGRADALHAKAPEVIRDRVAPRLVGPPPVPPGEPDTAQRIRVGPRVDTAAVGSGDSVVTARAGQRSGRHSALAPAGAGAARIAGLFRLFGAVTSLVWLSVMAMLAFAVVRGRRRTAAALDEASHRRARTAVLTALALTVLILGGLFASDLRVGRALAAATEADPELTIELIGNQWWWEARYEHADAAGQVTTANELHVPVGRRVLLKLRSRDVIHSVWVPALHGKQDLIPGYTNALHIQADSAGVYAGQCAEYCGHQHAYMRLLVVAEPEAQFRAWLARQRQPAAAVRDERQRRGRAVFLSSTCVMCHTVRGTPAGGRTGPDLTHVGSRRTLAAGRLANTRANLALWIASPQHIKPGVRMPATPLAAEDLDALVAWLESLQ